MITYCMKKILKHKKLLGEHHARILKSGIREKS